MRISLHKKSFSIVTILLLLLTVFSNKNLVAQCNPKALYDQLVGGYHGAIAKGPDGNFKVWGEDMQNDGLGNALSPQTINNVNYPALTGTPLFASLGGNNNHQAIVISTTGLFAWGFVGGILDATITTGTGFQKLTINGETDGLPIGINPTDVQMIFTSYQLLGILTNTGSVYVISQILEARGAGAGATSATQWYQVTSSAGGNPAIANITAIRGNGRGSMMALSSTGILYTWGASTFLGDASAPAARDRATPMTLPAGVLGTDIKMIGMTARTIADPSSHYLLTNGGSLYSLGENTNRQLGDFTIVDRTSWVNVKKTAILNFTDCIFFSPNEHDLAYAAVGAIDANYDLYNWGLNHTDMLGRGGTGIRDPGVPAGFTPGVDNAFLIEIGGHISLLVKEGSSKYCYVGHRSSGSMGDGLNTSSTITAYDCIATGDAQVCGATTFDAGDLPNSYEGNGTTDYCSHNLTTANNTTLYLGTILPTANNMNFKNVAPFADNNASNGDGVQEDGLPAIVTGVFIGNSSYSLTVNVTNTTGANANLYSWIDWNRDGDLLDPNESATTVVANGATTATINYATLPAGLLPHVKYYIRLRFTSTTLVSPLGYAPDGEVEDYFMKAVQLVPDVNVTFVNVAVTGNVATNDGAPAGTTYGTPVAIPGNPGPAVPTMNANGTYSFTSAVPGVFYFNVPVCPPGQSVGCPMVQLKITVLDPNVATNPPVANTDIATTAINTPVTLNTLANDNAGNPGGSLNPASVTVTSAPSNGTTSVNPATGNITYTPNPGFTGIDTLTYQVCDNSTPIPFCTTAIEIITVLPATGVDNNTKAADDYKSTPMDIPVSGNVLTNDSDPNGNTQTVTTQNTTIPGVGTLVLNSDGSYTFTPVTGYTGPAVFPYQVCDNGIPVACTNATLYILVANVGILPVNVLQFSAERNGNNILIKWKTENEFNVNRYEVEYSTDGINFINGGTVTADNNSAINNYQFTLLNYNQPLYYMRLKSVDNDARFKYSGVIRIIVVGKTVKTVAVLPNPVTDILNVRISSDVIANAAIKLYNNLGQVIHNQNSRIVKGDNLITINQINNIAKGIYTLTVVLDTEVFTTKVFRQ